MDKFKQIFDLIKELTDEDFEVAMEIAKNNIQCDAGINRKEYAYVNEDVIVAIKAIGYLDLGTVRRLQDLKDNRLAVDELLKKIKGEPNEQINAEKSE